MLSNRLALVTGGAQGIGRAAAEICVREGATVVIGDIKGTAAMEAAKRIPGEHWAVEINVADKNSVQEAFHNIVKKFSKPPSVLINSAGITQDNFITQMDEQIFMNVINVNLKGSFLITQAFSSSLLSAGIRGGSIVHFSSVSSTGNMGQVNYSASKAGVVALTKTAAKELAQQGIRVNAVRPGFTETPMTETVPEKVVQKLIPMIPLRRFAKPEEIAEVAVFLASDKSSYMSGAIVDVTGGLSI